MSQWVKVADSLPDFGAEVVVYNKVYERNMFAARFQEYESEEWHWTGDEYSMSKEDVTQWLMIPERERDLEESGEILNADAPLDHPRNYIPTEPRYGICPGTTLEGIQEANRIVQLWMAGKADLSSARTEDGTWLFNITLHEGRMTHERPLRTRTGVPTDLQGMADCHGL